MNPVLRVANYTQYMFQLRNRILSKFFLYQNTNIYKNQDNLQQKSYLSITLDEGKERQDFDLNEIADVKWIKKEKIKEMIKNNELKDGLTLSGLMYYLFLN